MRGVGGERSRIGVHPLDIHDAHQPAGESDVVHHDSDVLFERVFGSDGTRLADDDIQQGLEFSGVDIVGGFAEFGMCELEKVGEKVAAVEEEVVLETAESGGKSVRGKEERHEASICKGVGSADVFEEAGIVQGVRNAGTGVEDLGDVFDAATFSDHVEVFAGEEDFVLDGVELGWDQVLAEGIAFLPVLVRVVLFETFAADRLLLLDEEFLVRVADVAVVQPLVQHGHVGATGFPEEEGEEFSRGGISRHGRPSLSEQSQHSTTLAHFLPGHCRIPPFAERFENVLKIVRLVEVILTVEHAVLLQHLVRHAVQLQHHMCRGLDVEADLVEGKIVVGEHLVFQLGD